MNNRFENREHAGIILAEQLKKYQNLDPIILALPRGGLPVAHQIASLLHAPLDVVLVKKIGAPGHEEFAIGAVGEDEKPILNQKLIKQYHFNPEEIECIIVNRITEIRNRAKVYRKAASPLSLEGRNVIVVDDGLATGATMKAAVQWLSTQKIKKIIVAVPVSSKEAAAEVKKMSNDFVSLLIPDNFLAVGMWYKDFPQVSDEEVIQFLLKRAQKTKRDVWIEDENIKLQAGLSVPPNARAIIVFSHGGGSSPKSSRNLFVSKKLNNAGYATLLLNLLTDNEILDRNNIFNIELITSRLVMATKWVRSHYAGLPIGYFGTCTGVAAALGASISTAKDHLDIFAIVSRGGRPDLALEILPKVYPPTLLLVGAEDKSIIAKNENAKDYMKNSKLILIPNAGHLFEESGAMDQVADHTINWFSNCLALHSGHKTLKDMPDTKKLITEIEINSTPFTKLDDLNSWMKKISKHKIIMLGESTHGTKEFYSLRREISKQLIQNYGFKFIAVEGDWPECNKINNYIQEKNNERLDSKEIVRGQFHRWPTWMWSNEEIPSLIDWIKNEKKIGFYGLDVYSLFESVEEIKRNLDRIDPKIAVQILDGYKCFDKYKCDEIAYAKSLLKLPAGCQEEIIGNLRTLLRLRLQDTTLSKESLFDIKQNARVIANAEKYYRAMITGGVDSWNVRDLHMMETLENLINLHGPDSKVIVWAHNTHIGDYHATDMLENGYINLGGLARERFGIENVYLLGLSSYAGELTAGKSWGGVEQVMDLPKAAEGSYEDYFHQASLNMKAEQFLISFNELEKDSPLYNKLGHRAIGVVYDPEHESHSNYIPTQMAKRYDGLIFIDQTNALKSLPTIFVVEEFPETWPEGQ